MSKKQKEIDWVGVYCAICIVEFFIILGLSIISLILWRFQ